MKILVFLLWLVPALILLMPVVGVLGPAQLATLYGLEFSDPNLELLMRHRAVLFGLLGALLLAAGLRPSLRPLGLVAGFASLLSFLGLAAGIGGTNAAIARVVAADWVAVACLVAAAALHWRARNAGSGQG